MSQPAKEDDEIWNSLFGDDNKNNDASSPKKGHTTLAPKRSKSSRHPPKRRKVDARSSSSSSSSSSRSSSQSASHRSNNSHSHHPKSNGHRSNNNYSSSQRNQSYADGPTTAERLSQFLCTPKHRARLPPPPLKCKYLKYPHKNDRFIKYCATNLELNYQWEMHHNSLFPLPLDLMDPDYYNPLKQPDEYDEDAISTNHKEDERVLNLLRDREYKRTAKEDRSIPEQEAFLLQTQYLTGGQEYELTELQRKGYDQNGSNGRGGGSRRGSSRNGRNKKRRRDYNDDDDDEYNYGNNNYSSKRNNPHSIKNVEKSFNDVQNIVRHPRRGVEVDKMFDVFPHDMLLDLDYCHIQFDNNPAQHTKKCTFMPKYEEQRMEMAQKVTQNALLRCVNQKKLTQERARNSKLENDDDDDDMNDLDKNDNNNNNDNNNLPDWFSLYASDPDKKKLNDDYETYKYQWSSEFVAVGNKPVNQFFLVIPKDDNTENEEVYYAKYDRRISLRHRQTDSSNVSMIPQNSKKGLSEADKKFFKQQPMNIKLNVPRDSDQE